MKKGKFILLAFGFILVLSLSGCGSISKAGLSSQYPVPKQEADWIVKGQPLKFEEQPWYPQDYVDILLDSEVMLVGEYKEVQIFVEKIDVRPYDRLYTKFGINKFRVFTKEHDKGKKSL